jgi:ferritin-like metal-binding protein YciE
VATRWRFLKRKEPLRRAALSKLGAARGKKCDAIEGILDEGTEIMDEYKGEPALDAACLRQRKRSSIMKSPRYGTLKNWAGKLGLKDAAKLLDQTLAEDRRRAHQARRYGSQR